LNGKLVAIVDDFESFEVFVVDFFGLFEESVRFVDFGLKVVNTLLNRLILQLFHFHLLHLV